MKFHILCLFAAMPLIIQGQSGIDLKALKALVDSHQTQIDKLEASVVDGQSRETALKSELTDLKGKLTQLDWVKTQSYCIFKKGNCPAGFKAVSLKTWIQRGSSGHMTKETATFRTPWGDRDYTESVRMMHWEKESLGNIGDSYIHQKCVEKKFNGDENVCSTIDPGVIKNENGVLIRPIDGRPPQLFLNLIASNEFVLNACCK